MITREDIIARDYHADISNTPWEAPGHDGYKVIATTTGACGHPTKVGVLLGYGTQETKGDSKLFVALEEQALRMMNDYAATHNCHDCNQDGTDAVQ